MVNETQKFAEDYYDVPRSLFILFTYSRFNGNSGAMQDALNYYDEIQMDLENFYGEQLNVEAV